MDVLLLEGKGAYTTRSLCKGLNFGRLNFKTLIVLGPGAPQWFQSRPSMHQHWLGSFIQHSSSLQVKLEY